MKRVKKPVIADVLKQIAFVEQRVVDLGAKVDRWGQSQNDLLIWIRDYISDARTLLLSYEGEREEARRGRDAERLRFENLVKAVAEAMLGTKTVPKVLTLDEIDDQRVANAVAVYAKARAAKAKNGC